MRLLDKLLLGKFDQGLVVDQSSVINWLRGSQLVVVDNVADYWIRHKEHDEPQVSDFPNVMLPFEHTFVEMRFPSSAVREAGLESAGLILNMSAPSTFLEEPQTGEMRDEWLFGPDTRWHLTGLLFLQYRGGDPVLMSKFVLPVNDNGCAIPLGDRGRVGMNIQPLRRLEGIPGNELVDLNLKLLAIPLWPALLAISFMHCRNVTMVKEGPPLPLSRKHERRTGRPLLRYHVLKIDHMKEVLEREDKASTGGLKQALHICRGHFKHYGRDGKGLLFGKHAGTVWISMHTRGSARQGVVVKDYEVK